MRNKWKKISGHEYVYSVSEDIEFILSYELMKISVMRTCYGIDDVVVEPNNDFKYEGRYHMSGVIDNVTYSKHILISTHLETAMVEVEKIVSQCLADAMKKHLKLGNDYANLLASIIT